MYGKWLFYALEYYNYCVCRNSNGVHLLVLHPRQLSVHWLSGMITVGEQQLTNGHCYSGEDRARGSVEIAKVSQSILLIVCCMIHLEQLKVNILIEQSLNDIVWYCLIHSDVSESICVQSMDGQLSVCEQDVLTFAGFLPSILIPGPLVIWKRPLP